MWHALIHESKSNYSRPRFNASSSRTSHMEHAPGSAENLNIARSAGPWWILTSQTLPKFSFWRNLAYHKISPNFNCFIKFSNFHVHGPDLDRVQTFHQKFFKSWHLHHLNLHKKLWYRTKGKRKRLTDFRARTQNVKKVNQKNRAKIRPIWRRWRRVILLYKPVLRNRLYKLY